jgi:hypothetical protein
MRLCALERWAGPLVVICSLSSVALGCGDCGGKRSAPATSGASKGKKLQEKAVLEGVVRLAPGATLPAYTPEQMEKKLLKKLQPEAPPAICTPPKVSDRQPVQLTADGLLSGVMLAPSNFTHQPTRPPLVHEITIEDCRLKPQLVVAMKGDSLRVRSTVNYAFMPNFNEGPAVRTLLPGQTYDVNLDEPGVRPLLCGFTASCGRTDVIVMLHPLYTTTDSSGKFRFDDFPAGETVTLSAWHPLFQEAKLELHLEPGEHKQVELVIQPVPQAPTPTPTQAPTPAPAPAKPKGSETQPPGKPGLK